MNDIVERLRQPASFRNTEIQRREAADEIERLREQVASLQASSGYETCIAQVEIERLRKTAIETMQEMLRRANEIERLLAVLRYISGLDDVDADEAPLLARHALEPKP